MTSPYFRDAVSADLASVKRLLDAAFVPSRYESRLIAALMDHACPLYHWLLEDRGEVVAYIA
jgi:hypothetical protein